MQLSTRTSVAIVFVGLLALGACQNYDRGGSFSVPLPQPDAVSNTQDVAPLPPPPDLASMPGVGDVCGDALTPCRDGLACIEDTCRAIGTSTTGTTCLLSDECTDGLVCGLEGRCAAEGAGAPGALCVRPDGCQKGQVCASAGFYGTCVESGTSDLGEECAITRDCLSGLFCSSEGNCNTPSPFYGYEGWQGIECGAVEEGAPRVFFELAPRADGDFFRHPFPSDLRLTDDGTIDLSSFPTPGGGLDGRDAVASLIDGAMENQRGFSTTPTILFRFSDSMDLASFRGKDQEGSPATLRYVNIEPESVARGYGPSFNWYVTTGGGRYVCPRWAAVRTAPESPLRPGEQYAVLLLEGVSTASGTEFEVDSDLIALLQSEAPTDPALAAAWETYANLRSFMADEAIAAESVVGAAVFTPGSPQAVTGAVSGATAALPIPAPAQATFCEGAATSPCDDGLTGELHVRGCLGSPPGVDEIHFKLELPVVQQGQRPYEGPGSGGDVIQAADGSISIASTESVCVSMAVSNTQAMPPTGWPLVIVAPDIGDTYRSAVDALAPMVNGLEHEEAPTGAIVVSWEPPLHGARATSEQAPLARVRNFMNSGAARGNVLQGVADLSEVLRAMSTIAWTADVSPTGQAIAINPAQIAVMGHGHGATIASLAAAQETDVDLMVLSGGGANVAATWLDRMEPIEAQTGVALALGESDDEGPMTISKHHPAMLRFSSFMSSVDPVNHVHLLANKPLDGLNRKHVLNVFGVEDPNVSSSAARLFARRLGAPIVGTVLDTISGLDPLEAPASLTLGPDAELITAGTIQAAGQEGASSHDVFYNDAGVRAQVGAFLSSWLATGEPVIIERP
jgi:hypothetical protein